LAIGCAVAGWKPKTPGYSSKMSSAIGYARIEIDGPPWKGVAAERLSMTAGVLIIFVVGYFGPASLSDPTTGLETAIALDRRIPFIAQSVWIYLWVFTAALIPLFVVRCPRLLRRTALAYVMTIAVSVICFAACPTTSAGLRVSGPALDFTRPSDWLVGVLYSLDPPCNLFPSLHVSIALLAAFSAWRARRLYGAGVYVGVSLVAGAVCAVKQHFLLDVVGGIALAALVGGLIIGPYRTRRGAEPAYYGWRGPASYFGFLVFVYSGIFAGYVWSVWAAR
jgi:membrane-associated phospholipid phosphatase